MRRANGPLLAGVLLALSLLGLLGGAALAARPSQLPAPDKPAAAGTPVIADPYHHLSGVLLWPPERMAQERRAAAGASGPITLPVFGPNVNATNASGDQNETTIAINPDDPQIMIASANDYRCGLCPYVYRSTNGGASWLNYPVSGAGGLLYGDPAMAFGTGSHAYFAYLGYGGVCDGLGGMYVSRSVDAGASFSPPLRLAQNFINGQIAVLQDKEYIAVDNNSGSPYYNSVYEAWTQFVFQRGTGCGLTSSQLDASLILSRSTDQGLTWSTPITVSPPISNNNQGAVPAVGRHGEVYVYYLGAQTITQIPYDTILFSRSTDGGQTFPFFTHIASIVDLPSPLPHTNFRDNAFGAMAVDQQLDGYLYAVWADYATGDADIRFARSTDNGTTWGSPQRVNDDPVGDGKDQFFPWIATAPDGRVHIAWFDRREDPNDANYKEYYTDSLDHGATFEPNVPVSDQPSLPGGSGFIGDYSGIAASAGQVVPIWTDIRTGGDEEAYVARGIYGPSPTPGTPSATPTASATATATATQTAIPSLTTTVTPTPLACTVGFTDVPPSQPFYPYIQWMACRSYISGYTCGGPGEPCVPPQNQPYFRPGANVTRGQLLKMVINAGGFPLVNPAPNYTFADVPPSQPFFVFIETGAAHGLISGYACGGPGEPCDPQFRPYFRPNADITRGQLAKVISLARGYSDPAPSIATFNDVPPSNPFFLFIERVAAHNVVSGYACDGAVRNPCTGQLEVCPGPYFRPCNPATRGQVAKMVTIAYGGP